MASPGSRHCATCIGTLSFLHSSMRRIQSSVQCVTSLGFESIVSQKSPNLIVALSNAALSRRLTNGRLAETCSYQIGRGLAMRWSAASDFVDMQLKTQSAQKRLDELARRHTVI